MAPVLFVEYPKCSTCRKAKKWLDEHDVAYTDRHIVEDRPTASELAAWQQFFRDLPVQMIQVRNLNIDPDAFLEIMPEAKGKVVGTKKFLETLKAEFPQLVIGSFSHYVEG